MQDLKQLVPEKVCLKCDICCRFPEKETVWSPVLSKDEAEQIRAKDLAKIKVTDNNGFELISSDGGYICPCLSAKDNRCKIYEFRPFDCQLYPFVLTSDGQKISLAADLKCPFIFKGIESGSFKKDLDFSRYIQYLNNLLNSSHTLDYISKNPQLVGNYTEDIIILASLDKLSNWVIKKNNGIPEVKQALP
ncbi:MAG: YkgJ family cysteine cluster protein [Candidatus Omnitrophota bacterium]